MIERLPKERILTLRSDFLGEQLYIIMNDFLNEQWRCHEALSPEENWYYALKVLDRLKDSKRMEIEINLLRSDIEEDLSELLSPEISCHATLVLMWCVYFMLRTYFDSENSPYKDLKKSLIRFLYDDVVFAERVEESILEMECHEEKNGRFVPYMDYMEHAVTFLSKENHINDLPAYELYPEIFKPKMMPFWKELQKVGIVDENYMKHQKTTVRELSVIADEFDKKFNIPNKNTLFGSLWKRNDLAQALYSVSTAKRIHPRINTIKSIFNDLK